MNNTKRVIGLRDKIPNINSNTEMSTYQKQVKTLRDDLHTTPIQSTTPQIKDDPRTKTSIFKSGLFKDGYQIGDLTKTILGTTGDIVLDVTKGVAGIGEGLVDAARYGIAAIADTFGADEYADDVRKRAEMDVINTILDPLDNYVEQASVLGDTVDSIVQSLGYMGGILATGGLGAAAKLGTGAVTALTTGTTFASSFGNNATEAYKEGATNDEAMKYGLISGLAEAGTELLFGGMGKLVNAKGLSTGITSVDDIIASKVSNVFKSQLGKNLSQFTVKAGAEGIEEVLSGMIQGMGQYITYKTKEDGYTWDQIMQDQRLLEQFISGAIVSGIFQTPSLIQSTRSGRDFVTGLTKTEEAELVKNTNDVISEIETKTKQKLTNDQKNNIKRELTSRLAIDVNLNDVLTKTGITSDSINNMKDLGTVDAALDVLNDLYTQFVPADKLAQHINSDIYTRIVELETKRTDIINQMNEQDKLNIKKELEAQKSETTNSIKQASIDNEIEQINDSIDKNEAIPVMKNNTYVTQHSVDLLNTAQTLLDERGFDGTIMTDLTKDQLRIEELGSMFGKKVVFLDGADFSGVTLPENSEIIFINKKINSGLLTNTKNKNKMLYTLGHELYHSLKIDNPTVYNEFINYIKSDITTEQITEFMTNYDSADTDKFYETLHINGKFDLQEILNNPKKYKVQNESLNRIIEEMVANEFGGMITDAEYMQNLQSKNPTLFDKIVDTIRKILDTLTKPIYKSSLTQLQITDIRNQFETIVSQVKSGQTLSDVKPDTTQVEKPVDKTVVEDTKPTKKVEDIGKETTTTKLDSDTWFNNIQKMYDNYTNQTDTKRKNDTLKSVIKAYENYKKQGGTNVISELDTILSSEDYKASQQKAEATKKADFKEKLKAQLDIRKLPTKTSKFAENISTTGAFADLVDYATKNQNITQYESTTHKVDTDKAIQKIRDNATGAIQDFFSKPSTQLDSVDSAMGEILLNFYKSKKDINSELAVYNKLREGGTASGQFIESLKRFKQLSPAATVLGIEQDLQRAYDEMHTSTDKTIVAWMNANADKARLTDAERKWIYQMVEKASKYDVESREYELTYALINSFIADRIPKTFTNKLKTFRRLAMLFNPKTQIRNFGGNAIMVPVNIGSDFIGASLDKYLSKKYDTSRTLGKFNEGGGAGKSFAKGLQIATEDYKLGVKTSDVGTGYDLPQGQTFNKDTRTGRALNWVEKLTNYSLDAGDRGYTQMYYDNSLNNQMKLNGVTEATDTMKQIAMEEAAKKTWKNESKLVRIASSARETLNKVHIGEIGLGDIVIPFVMTPANLAVATYEYSPAAALSVYNNAKKFNEAVKSGKDIALAQKNLVDSFGKATMGTLLYAIAFAAAKKGLITGDEDEDKDIRNLMRAQGFQPFSIKIGDTSYTYDWAQPIASPFAVMAELERTTQLTGEKQSIFEAIVKAFSIGGSRLEEQSFLSSLKTLFSGDDMISGLINVGMSVPASFIPTLFNQVGTLIDSNSKYTYDKNPLKSMLYQAAVKIPGVKSFLPSRVNVLGQDIEMYSGKNNIFNVMLNPANVSSDVAGEVGNEIMNVYNHTGESSIIPSVTSTYIDYTVDGNKKRVNLSLEQQSELQKLMGTIAYNAISEMMLSDTYNSASYDEKATALTSLVSYAKAKAIEESGFAEGYSIKGGDALQINNYINKGLSISNAVMYDSIINSVKSLKDIQGNTIKGSENGQKAYLIMNMPISDTQKNVMLKLISPTANTPETVDTLSNLQSEQDFIDYYSLSRSDYFVQNKFSRDDYDSAVNYYGFTGTQFIEYVNELTNIKSDYNANGEVISNSKKNKTISYIESLPLTAIQKVYLYGMAGYSVKGYRNQLFEYINSLNISVDEKNTLWKNLGF